MEVILVGLGCLVVGGVGGYLLRRNSPKTSAAIETDVNKIPGIK